MIRKKSREGPNRYAKLAKRLFQAFAFWYKNCEKCWFYTYCAIQRGVCYHFENHGLSRDKNWAAKPAVC